METVKESGDNLSTLPGNRRDPRVNPKVGDVVLSSREFLPFHVARVHDDGSISGRFGYSGMFGSLCGLHYWRNEWAKGATVIHNADDDATKAAVAQQSGEVIKENV